ncbi:MAG: uracil-DNA glycosylase [Deltaproteobacteria bacterium]|nr:uracil-DNA glycosylase [Deltaproteobacteria bacterium]
MAEETKNYLSYLKEIGIEELPVKKLKNRSLPPNASIGGQRLEVTETDQKPPASSLESVREELGDCKRCKLHKTRTNIVFGVGNPNAGLIFVGEGPGEDEDLKAEPFVGRAGQLLTKIIKAMGLNREDVYICNVVKCRPPGNRNPEPDEIAACRPFMEKQIDAIRPKVIVALGTHAAQTLLNTDKKITALRGKFHLYRDSIRLMPTFHPSYLLRNDSKKKEVWEDMKTVLKALGLKIPDEKK